MSIIIAGNLGSGAFVVTDTWCARDDGAPPRANKLYTLPYQSAVLAGRGSFGFISNIAMQAAHTGADVDDLAAEIPAIIARVMAMAPEGLAHLPGGNGVDVVLVGWSAARAGAALYGFHQSEIGGEIETHNIAPGYALAAPWDLDMGEPPTLGDLLDASESVCETRLRAVARRQCRKMDELFPPKSSGGNLVLAMIERERITTMRLCDLDAPMSAPEPVEQGAAA